MYNSNVFNLYASYFSRNVLESPSISKALYQRIYQCMHFCQLFRSKVFT